jgi:hypothetical protein
MAATQPGCFSESAALDAVAWAGVPTAGVQTGSRTLNLALLLTMFREYFTSDA